jgi:surface antigen
VRAARRVLSTLLSTSTAVLAALAVTVTTATPALALGNDYPYRYSTTNAADRWGFTQRQCVSFVAWREAQAGRPLNNALQRWGSAANWDDAARRLGVAIGTRPVVGAIAQWNAYERSPYWGPGSSTANGYVRAGGYGHVAWVRGIYSDGSVLVEQYNMGSSRSYSYMRVRAPRYLYDAVGGYPAARRS